MPEHLWLADLLTVTIRMIQCPDCAGEGFDLGSLRQPEICHSCAGYGDILHPDEVAEVKRKQMEKARYADLKRQPPYIEGTGGRFGT